MDCYWQVIDNMEIWSSTWTLMKCLEEKAREEVAPYKVSVVSSRKTHQERRARYAGHCWRNKDEHISGVIRTLTHRHASVGRQAKNLLSSIWRRHWMPSRGLTKCDCREGQMVRESKETVQSARFVDNDDDEERISSCPSLKRIVNIRFESMTY